MRWAFIDERDAEEAAARAGVLRRIDAWWAAFAAEAGGFDAHFRRGSTFDIPAFTQRTLQAVDGRLCWEFGPPLRGPGGHRLVLTPESDAHLRPLVAALLARAPALAGWEFYPYRPPESAEWAAATVQGRCGVEVTGAEVRVTRGNGNLVDLTFRSAAWRGLEPARATGAAFVLAESLLGEEAMDRWVGVIEAEAAPKAGLVSKLFGGGSGSKAGGSFIPIERLKPTFDSVVGAARDQLPARPLYESNPTGGDTPWTSYQLDPDAAPPGTPRGDLFIGSSAAWPVSQAALRPGFYSGRFSRCGETFCYLKLDRAGVPREQWVDWRGRFEDAITPALAAARLGCIFANGTGRDYSYVDLAVVDVPAAARVIRDALRPLGPPAGSWLLFFDPDLADEWIGLRDDTPPPPPRDAPPTESE